MAVGQPIPYSKVRIAGDDDQALPENHIGHILISGDNVTKGYFENPEANAKGFTARIQGIAGCAPAISE